MFGSLIAGHPGAVSGPAATPSKLPGTLPAELAAALQELRLPPLELALQNPQAPGAAASVGLARLMRLAAAWPGMFANWIRFQPGPGLIGQLARAMGYPGTEALTGPLGDARLVLALAFTQRAFNTQLAAGSQPVKPGVGDLQKYPRAWLNEATGEKEGLPSLSGLERRLQNLDQVAYRTALQRAGLQPVPDHRQLERPLVEAGFLKYALHLWNKLPDAARVNVMEIAGGPTWPRPWYVYWPVQGATITELLLRLLTLVEDTRQDIEAHWRAYGPEPALTAPVTLGRIPGLEGWRIPPPLKARFADPMGPGGEIHPQTLISLALKAKVFAKHNFEPGLRQIASRRGQEGLNWLINGTPSLEVFNKAFDYRNRLIGGQSFARVVSRVPEYFDVIVVPNAPCDPALLAAIAPMIQQTLAPAQPGRVAPARAPRPLWPGGPPVLQPPPGGGPPGGGPPPGKGGPPWQPWNPWGGPPPGEGGGGGGGGGDVPFGGPIEGGGGAPLQQAKQKQKEAQLDAQQAQMLQKQAQMLGQKAAQKAQAAQQAQARGDQAGAAQQAQEAQRVVQEAQRAAQAATQKAQQAAIKVQQAAAAQAQAAVTPAVPVTAPPPVIRPTKAARPATQQQQPSYIDVSRMTDVAATPQIARALAQAAAKAQATAAAQQQQPSLMQPVSLTPTIRQQATAQPTVPGAVTVPTSATMTKPPTQDIVCPPGSTKEIGQFNTPYCKPAPHSTPSAYSGSAYTSSPAYGGTQPRTAPTYVDYTAPTEGPA